MYLADLVRDLTEKSKKYDSNDASIWFAKVGLIVSFFVMSLF